MVQPRLQQAEPPHGKSQWGLWEPHPRQDHSARTAKAIGKQTDRHEGCVGTPEEI